MHKNWMMKEIGMGLSKLLCLRLQGQPPEDMVEGTVAAWFEALTFNRVWDESRDAPRLRRGFQVLCATRTDWPSPLNLIESLPRVEPQKALPAKVVSDEVAQQNIEKIRSMLKGTTWPVYDPDPVLPIDPRTGTAK